MEHFLALDILSGRASTLSYTVFFVYDQSSIFFH